MSQEQPIEDKPFHFFHLTYEGNVEEFKKLLKKKISFDFKDLGNNTIYLKIKKQDFETNPYYFEHTFTSCAVLGKFV